MPRSPLRLAIALLLAATVQPVFAQRDTTLTHSVFGSLLLVVERVAFTLQAWEDLLTKEGLTGSSGSGEMWTKKDSIGEVRAGAFFNDNETLFFMLYFPTDQRPIPEALLAHLLAGSRGTQIVDGDTVEIALATRNLTEAQCQGTRKESLAVRLTGGTLVRTSVAVTCGKATR